VLTEVLLLSRHSKCLKLLRLCHSIGVQDGQYIVDRLGGEGLLLDIRDGPADNTIGLARTNGMLSVVEQSNIEVVMAPDFGGWSEDGGFTIMEDMLAKYDRIDVVFCRPREQDGSQGKAKGTAASYPLAELGE
jgi:hypothetical protein